MVSSVKATALMPLRSSTPGTVKRGQDSEEKKGRNSSKFLTPWQKTYTLSYNAIYSGPDLNPSERLNLKVTFPCLGLSDSQWTILSIFW